MTIYLVTRHQGAIDWINHQGITYEKHLTHLHDVNILQAADVVVGSLPINIVADICERGATYVHLSLYIPEELRGKELTVQQLDDLNAQLESYHVQRT